MGVFGDHEDHEYPADHDDEDYTTAKIIKILLMMLKISILKSISLPRWFPAWKDEGGGAVEASWPEDRAPGETELFEFLLFLFLVGNNRFYFKVEVGPRCTLRESDEVK